MMRLLQRYSVGLLLFGLLMTVRVDAHGYIVRAIPEDRAVLERPPTRVQYWFSEDLEPAFSQITLLNQNGEEVAAGAVDAEDQSLMVLRPPSDLPDGAYIVSLRPAFASDGHVVAETRVFFVGESVAGVDGTAASDRAVPLEVVWRGIVLTATSVLFGVTVLYNRVLVPAWGSKRFTAGFLPPRVVTRALWIAWVALAVALIGNGLAILQNAMVVFNQPIGAVIANGTWNTARLGSRFGDVWNVRMVLLLVVTGVLALMVVWRNEKPRTVAPFWQTLMWANALVVGTFAASSHATGALVMPWVAVLMHWLHMTAVAVWTGGLVALVLLLPPALAPYEGDQRRMALLAVMGRFSWLATGALAVTVTTGVYNATNWLYTPAEITTTTYGLALVYKTVLVVALVAVGAVHHVAARPTQYAKLAALFERVGGWRLTLPLEVVLVVVVIVSAGWVSATPPPTPAFIENDAPAPQALQTVDGLQVEAVISPGGLGVNTYDVRLSADDSSFDGATVYVRMVRPTDDRRGIWHESEQVEDNLFVAAGDELDETGEWLTLVDVVRDDTTTRAVFTWDVTNQASVIQAIPPRGQHWAALIAVLLVSGWVAYPSYQAFMRQMNFTGLTAGLVFLAVAATVIVTVAGFVYIAQLEAQNAALLNPPPQSVNTVLPTGDSIERGARMYASACGWNESERVFASFVDRLPRTRDDDLYRIVADGWRDLPACNGALAESDRWDIVNYWRTLEPR
jgi:copper transport protein